MKKCCIFFVHGISGGTATLSYRIGKLYQRKGYDIFYIFHDENHQQNLKLMADNGFILVKDKILNWKRKGLKIAGQYDKILMFTYSFDLMPVSEYIKARLQKKMKTIDSYLYVVHTEGLLRGTSFTERGKILNVILNGLNKPYIVSLSRRNQLIFMDKRMLAFTMQHLNMEFPESEDMVFYLPYSNADHRKKYKKEKFILCSMARMDFPFKGYLMELADFYCRLKEKYDIELWIIGDGKSYERLKRKIGQFSADLQKDIILYGGLDYDKAKEVVSRSSLFVGMGTGILDAVSSGVPCIAVKSFTYKCEGRGFFHEDPEVLGYEKETEGLGSVERRIEQVICMDEGQYAQLCEKEHKAFRDNYSLKKFGEHIKNHRNKRMMRRDKIAMIPYIVNLFFMHVYKYLKHANRRNGSMDNICILKKKPEGLKC